jgi:hypothetical protein
LERENAVNCGDEMRGAQNHWISRTVQGLARANNVNVEIEDWKEKKTFEEAPKLVEDFKAELAAAPRCSVVHS